MAFPPTSSRVLDKDGNPINGFYAAGVDRNNTMGAFYPSGGITIGPAITFSYLTVLYALTSNSAASARMIAAH